MGTQSTWGSTMGAVFSNVDGCCGEPDKETPVVGNNIATTSNPTIKIVETQPPPIPASQPPQESQESEIPEEPQKHDEVEKAVEELKPEKVEEPQKVDQTEEPQKHEETDESQEPETPLPHVAPLLKILDHAPETTSDEEGKKEEENVTEVVVAMVTAAETVVAVGDVGDKSDDNTETVIPGIEAEVD